MTTPTDPYVEFEEAQNSEGYNRLQIMKVLPCPYDFDHCERLFFSMKIGDRISCYQT